MNGVVIHSVIEHTTGDRLEVSCQIFVESMNACVVAVKGLDGIYRDLYPGKYDIWEILVPDENGKLTPKNIYKSEEVKT